jgi:hypothetical protein
MIKNKITLGGKCIETYPNRIPIIAHYKNNEKVTNNFLVPDHINVRYLMVLLRRNIKIEYDEYISILINDDVINVTDNLLSLFNKYKNRSDGCLHITINNEKIFKK